MVVHHLKFFYMLSVLNNRLHWFKADVCLFCFLNVVILVLEARFQTWVLLNSFNLGSSLFFSWFMHGD